MNRYKIDGQGNKVLVSTEKFTGYTDQLITADRNYYEKRLGNTVDDTDASHTYRYHDTAMNGYTYERIITQTITVTLADGSTRTFTVPGIPAAGLAPSTNCAWHPMALPCSICTTHRTCWMSMATLF